MIAYSPEIAITLLAVSQLQASKSQASSWIVGLIGFGACGWLLFTWQFYASSLVCGVLCLISIRGCKNWYTSVDVGNRFRMTPIYEHTPINNTSYRSFFQFFAIAWCTAFGYVGYDFQLTGLVAGPVAIAMIVLTVTSLLLLSSKSVETWLIQLPLYILLGIWAIDSTNWYITTWCVILFINACVTLQEWKRLVYDRDITWKLS